MSQQRHPNWVRFAKGVSYKLLLIAAVATLLFFAVDLMPGDPPCFGPGMTRDVCEQIADNRGLNDPLLTRYVNWATGAARGDFGVSHQLGRPVRDLIGAALPNTLILSGLALLLTFGFGIVLGVVQATRLGWVDRVLGSVLLFLYSMPSFWLAIMLILVLSGWGLFPASSMTSVDHESMSTLRQFLDRLHHLVLPVAALALVSVGGVARYTRASMLNVLSLDYIRAARARGLPERRVTYRHGLRSALLPVITEFGLSIPFLFGGAVLVEEVFSWPGMGRLMYQAIAARDMPVIMGAGLLFAVIVVASNALADLLYAAADPRVRYDRG